MKSIAVHSKALLLSVLATLALACAACSSTGGPPEIIGSDGGSSSSLITTGGEVAPPGSDAGPLANDASEPTSGDR